MSEPKKRRTFLNDEEGFTKEDFEKLITGLTFTLMVVVIGYKFLFDEFVVPEVLTFTVGLGGLFVARKAFSYFKSDSYYEYNKNYSNEKQTEPKQEQPKVEKETTQPSHVIEPEYYSDMGECEEFDDYVG